MEERREKVTWFIENLKKSSSTTVLITKNKAIINVLYRIN